MAPGLHEFLLRVKALFLRRRMERDMADELAFHHAMLREKLARLGNSSSDLDRLTQYRFGRREKWHEHLREIWQFRRTENLARDVSYSFRVLVKSPGFTLIAILTLVLGVGANTTVFSVINGLLLRPLPVPESSRLVVFGSTDSQSSNVNYSLSEPMFRGLEHRSDLYSEVFAFHHTKMLLKRGSGSENVPGQYVSGGFFSALQTQPLLGRTLTPGDDVKGGSPAGFAVVISESFWQRWFGRMPNVVGQKLEINNTLFTVAGVMPKWFIGADPLATPEMWVPLAAEPVMHSERSLTKAGFHAWWLTVMGRMNPQTTLSQANADAAAGSSAVLHAVIPDAGWVANREKWHFQFRVEAASTGFSYVRRFFRKPLLAVFAMCGGVLLLACLNLASLLTARGMARQKELATRLAMGATRRRLVQQLLVESFLLAATGTLAGLAVAPLVSQSLSIVLLGGASESHIDTSLDLRVFTFAGLAAIVAALVIGLVPALRATSGDLHDQIKNGQRTTVAYERRVMLPRIIMTAEVALAFMLIAGAGLLATSLFRLYRSGTGFDPRAVQNIAFSMDEQSLRGDALIEFYRQLGEGLRRQPGVKDVSFAWIVPFGHSVWDENLSAKTGKTHDVYHNRVSPNYFQTMRVPLIEGRDFAWSDTSSSGLKIILNHAAVALLFPDRDPIGQMVEKQDGGKTVQFQVIGVVGDAKYEDLRSAPPPTAYVSMTQDDGKQSASYTAVVRTDTAAPLVSAAYALAVQAVPELPRPVMTWMEEMVRDVASAERMMALLSAFFAVCALAVTAIGLYGTLAYATTRRTNEIGIRMALGARKGQVIGMVFRQNAAIAVAGTGGGLLAALLASRALSSFLYGTSAHDPWVFAGSLVTLMLIASAASLLPAVWAAGIQPMQAIRCE
jgi:predicted permease